MSSVQSFLKQINPSQRYSYVASTGLAALAAQAFEFVPVSGNYVGNYPPGGMVLATAAGTNGAFSAGLYNAILSAATTSPGGAQNLFVLRDMGKTVFAPVTTEANVANGSLSSAYGHFRQVQLLAPQVVTANQIGGSGASPFGVFGSSPAYCVYLTFYLQNCVVGDFGSSAAAAVPITNNGHM